MITDEGRRMKRVVVNLNNDGLTLNTDLTDPNKRNDQLKHHRRNARLQDISHAGRLFNHDREEILDLVAHLISGADPKHEPSSMILSR